ncbi:MAG: ATP-dependent RNA helicase HrpA, partial [Desulfobulbaceae bacterium]|nr:ATP-dependent RNA helicase HrpA [Desulfobulbaceae bacterium]
MTDGILLAEAQHDRMLHGYDTIIVDEAHERSLNIDFLLGILKRLLSKRTDLKVIITSATIDTAKFAKNFNNAPIINVEGRTFPVETRYQPPGSDENDDASYIEQAVQAVADIRRKEQPGDILIFMPTERDIRETTETITDLIQNQRPNTSQWPGKTSVLPLFGRLSAADQRRIFQKQAGHKIVIATNVAETSVTVPGIRYVIDTGLARMASYNVRARTTTMPVARISRASADQRKGRCGRIGPGICIRLYEEEDYLNRVEFTRPEILRSNLAEVILRMTSLKLGNPAIFPFIDPPSPRAINDGYSQLYEFGALTSHNKLTNRGRIMARLPLDPSIARMIIEARDRNALREITVIAAALSIQDPRVRPADKEAEADKAHERFITEKSDFLTLLSLWDIYHQTLAKVASVGKMRKFCKNHYLAYQRMREWRDIHEQSHAILTAEKNFPINSVAADYDSIHQAILSGNIRNIGFKKAKNIYLGGRSKELMVFPGSGQFNKSGQWIMAAELVETSKLFARTVANIKPEWLEPLAGDLCRSTYSAPHWEKKRGQVTATERVTLFGLTIVSGRKINYAKIKPDEARELFIHSALIEGEINGSYKFLEHNLKLAKSLLEMEDRVRQRDILADDLTLFNFYSERLPEDVVDQSSLNRLIKRKQDDSFLKMHKEDIVGQAIAASNLDEFPTAINMGELTLPLSYTFAPGSEEDGVTVSIPVELLDHVQPEIFEWLVPGFLLDKIIVLMKSLPKSIRKKLIPVPQNAELILEDLTPYQGSFFGAIEQAIYNRFRIKIDRLQWQRDSITDHLRMRYLLVDMQGNVLNKSRNFTDLTATSTPSSKGGELDRLRSKWQRDGIKSWDFADLPERITIQGTDKQLRGFAYPALTPDDKGTVAIKLTTSETESHHLTRQGLRLLYQLQFTKQVKMIKKDLTIPRRNWQLYEGIGSEEEINLKILYFALDSAFACGDGILPDRQAFDNKVAEIKNKGLYPIAKAAQEQVLEALIERRATLDFIEK